MSLLDPAGLVEAVRLWQITFGFAFLRSFELGI